MFISCAGKLYNTDVRCCVLLDRIAKDNVKELVDFRRKQVKIVQDKLRLLPRAKTPAATAASTAVDEAKDGEAKAENGEGQANAEDEAVAKQRSALNAQLAYLEGDLQALITACTTKGARFDLTDPGAGAGGAKKVGDKTNADTYASDGILSSKAELELILVNADGTAVPVKASMPPGFEGS